MLSFLVVAFQIAQVIFLRNLVHFFNTGTEDLPGFLFAFGLSLSAFLHQVISQHAYYRAVLVGTRCRVALIAVVYRKVFKLPTGRGVSNAHVLNLVANDAQRISDAAPLAHYIWISPVAFVIILAIVVPSVGSFSLISFALLILLVPLQGLFARLFTRLRRETVTFRDGRLRLITAVLANIEFIKVSVWETVFEKAILRLRQSEVACLLRSYALRAVLECISFSATPLMMLLTVAPASFLGHMLTIETMYSMLAFYNILKGTVATLLPAAVELVSEARISVNRLAELLFLPEFDRLCSVPSEQEPGTAIITFTDATFQLSSSDSSDSSPTAPLTPFVLLHSLNLSICAGEIVSVIGPVGR